MITLVLREIAQNGQVTNYALDTVTTLQVSPGSSYTLIDQATGQPAEGLTLARDGDNLEIQLNGELLASLEGFYVDGANISFSNSANLLASSTDLESEAVWEVAGQASSAAPGGAALAGLIAAGWALVASDGSQAASSIDAVGGSEDVAPQTVTVDAAAGPFITTMGVEIYGEDGTLLAELEHDFSTGPVPVDIDGSYTGALLIKVIDINDDNPDYIDEVNGPTSLGDNSIRAMATTDNSAVTVSPITEAAAVLAGISDDNTVTEEQVAANDQIAELVSALTGVEVDDILTEVTTVLDDDYDNTDGLTEAEALGNFLAVLSGADSSSGGISETIDALIADIVVEQDGTLTLGDEAAQLLTDGQEAFQESDNGDGDSTPLPGLDTTPPVILSVEVATSGSAVVVTFDEDVIDLSTQDFTLTVNDAEISFTAISIVGAVVTLTPAQTITGSDVVSLLATTAADDAGNVAADATSITNNSVALNLDFDKAFSTLTAEELVGVSQTGASGDDALSASVFEGESDRGIYNLAIDQAGDAGKDTITANLDGQFIGDYGDNYTYVESLGEYLPQTTYGNNLTLDGGDGDDALTVNLNAAASAVEVFVETGTGKGGSDTYTSTGVFAEVVSNSVDMLGGTGVDSLALNVLASGNGSELAQDGVEVSVYGNDFALDAGADADIVAVQISALADNDATGSATATYTYSMWTGSGYTPATDTYTYGAEADATVSYNDVDVYGGTGIDSVEIGINATAQADADAEADVYSNELFVQAENIDLAIAANATGSSASATNSYNNGYFNVSYSTVQVTTEEGEEVEPYTTTEVYAADVEGAVDIDVEVVANADAITYAYAYAYENDFLAFGGDSTDDVNIAINANASIAAHSNTDSVSATADVSSNSVELYAGAGNDTIGIGLQALAVNNATGTGLVTGTYSSGPSREFSGESFRGSYSSSGSSYTFGPNADASNSYNELEIYGGAGIDTVVIDIYASAQAVLEADAEVYSNELYITAENIDLGLVANATASNASASNSYNDIVLNAKETQVTSQYITYSSAVHTNTYSTIVAADVDGAVDIDLNIAANADAVTYAYAEVSYNDVLAFGGDSTDDVNIAMNANAFLATSTGNTTEGSATAYLSNNYATAVAGDGNDLITVQLGAFADNNATGAGTNTNTYMYTYYSSSLSTTVTATEAYTSFYNQEAYGYANYNSLYLYGETGIDTIAVDLTATAQATYEVSAYAQYNTVSATAENVDINLMAYAGVTADQTSPATAASASAYVTDNDISINRGSESSPAAVEGIANIDLNMAAYALGTTYAYASVYSNDIDIYGGDSGDSISVLMNAEATLENGNYSSEVTASAYVDYNTLSVQAGNGGDLIAVQLGAHAENNGAGSTYTSTEASVVTFTGTYESAYAYAYNYGHDLYLYGETGVDTVGVDLTAEALGSEASAYVGSSWSGNTVSASAENVDINLMAFAGMTADQTSPATAAGANAYVQNNDILINAASSYSSSPSPSSDGDIEGMADINVNLAANALATGSAYAYVTNNDIEIYGGDSADTISVALIASASGSESGAYVSYNDVFIDAGAGADAINLDVMGSNNYVNFYYEGAGDFGDTIVGLDQAFAGSNNISFEFTSAFASAGVFASAAAVTESAPAAFYYDDFGISSSYALYYDADGTGSAAASTVAIFATDIGGTSNFDINYTGSPF